MSYKVVITATAKKHLHDCYLWYEAKRVSLGREFRNEFKTKIDKLASENADYHLYVNGYRKLSLSRFPYYVYYERNESEKQIIIFSVLHFKRSPDEIKSLLR